MLSGVPNFAWTIGYTNASWTLKADLVAEYVCRLLKHMDDHDYTAVTPHTADNAGGTPFLDLSSGYVQRSLADLPKQGDRTPWRLHQNYLRDVRLLRRGPIDDEAVFTRAPGDSAVRSDKRDSAVHRLRHNIAEASATLDGDGGQLTQATDQHNRARA
jgi:monooxygenase